MTAILESENIAEEELINIFAQEQVISALNIAEAIKSKLLVISKLKDLLEKQELENIVRNYIAKHPWVISQRWETFTSETSLQNLIKEVASEVGYDEAVYNGRVDLVLTSGDHILIIEFMRPGLKLDYDHVDRYERYIRTIRTKVISQTGGRFNRVSGLVVADDIDSNSTLLKRIEDLAKDDMLARDWNGILEDAKSSYRDYLGILVTRGEGDPRLRSLLD